MLLFSHRGDTLRSAGHTNSTVTPEGHWVGVVGVHIVRAVGQLDGHKLRLVIGAHPLVGLDERWVQNWLLL